MPFPWLFPVSEYSNLYLQLLNVAQAFYGKFRKCFVSWEQSLFLCALSQVHANKEKKITSINFNNIISASTQILVYWEFAIQNCNMSQHSRFWPSKIKNIQYNFTNFIVILYFLNDTSDHK